MYEDIKRGRKTTSEGIAYSIGREMGDTKYERFLDAVESGKNLDRVIEGYRSRGVENRVLSSQVTSEYRDAYASADDGEREEMKDKLLDVYEELGYDRDEKYYAIDAWAEIGKYDTFYSAVESGKDLKKVIADYEGRGSDKKTLASQITSHFKPIYVEMSNSEKSSLKGYLLNAYALLGYDRAKKSKDIDKWTEE